MIVEKGEKEKRRRKKEKKKRKKEKKKKKEEKKLDGKERKRERESNSPTLSVCMLFQCSSQVVMTIDHQHIHQGPRSLALSLFIHLSRRDKPNL